MFLALLHNNPEIFLSRAMAIEAEKNWFREEKRQLHSSRRRPHKRTEVPSFPSSNSNQHCEINKHI